MRACRLAAALLADVAGSGDNGWRSLCGDDMPRGMVVVGIRVNAERRLFDGNLMHIRRYAEGEETSLREIFRSSVRGLACQQYTPPQIDAWSPPDERAELRAQWVERIQANQPWVVEVDGRLAAFADVQDSGYIDHFFVAAEFAGRGIGKALMRHLHEVALSRGTARLCAHVSLTAEPFFRHAGFIVEMRQRPTIRGVELDNAVMSKLLDGNAVSGPP